MNMHKLSKPTDVYMIPSMEDYTGFAVGFIGDGNLSVDFDGSVVCGGNAMIFNNDKTMFIVNCGHPLFKDQGIKKAVENDMLESLSLSPRFGKVVDDSIVKYFDGSFTPEPMPEPMPEPKPEPEQ